MNNSSAKFEERYLVYVDNTNSNKFYHMQPDRKSGNLTCRYGRIGAEGSTKVYPLSDYYRILSQKIRKGYTDITDNWKLGKVKESDGPRTLPSAVDEQLIAVLRRFSCDFHKDNLSVSFNTITDIMIKRQEEILEQIRSWQNSPAVNANLISFLFTQLYSNIPRVMKNTRLWYPDTTEDIKRLYEKEYEYLQDLKQSRIINIMVSETNSDNAEHEILDKFSLSITAADPAEENHIRTLMGSTSGQFVRAWKVTNASTEDAFRRWCTERHITDGGTKLLWHGSRNENWLNILSFGLLLKNKAVKTGSMFGHGLYFAPKARKSMGYTSIDGSVWASGTQSTGFLALYDVAYGNPYHVNNFKTIDPAYLLSGGYDCVHAHAGTGMLRNDEIVVYSDSAATIRYLVEISA